MKRLLTIPFLLISLILGATDYYVRMGGNDAASGTTEANAWATLNRVTIASLAAGDNVLFHCGDTFRGYLRVYHSGSGGSPITYTSYGTGDKPKILGSKDFSSSSYWEPAIGLRWQTNIGVSAIGDVGNLIFNNEASYGVKKTSVSNCLTQGDYYYDDGSDVLYLYSASNPGTFYTHIEVGGVYYENNIYIPNQDYITIDGLDTRYSANNGIFTGYGSSNIIIQNNDISYIGGMYVLGGTSTRMGNGVQMWIDNSDITVRYNKINQCYDAGISPQGAGTYTQSDINIYYNLITNCYYSYEIFTRTSATITNVNFYNNTCIDAGHQWSDAQRPDPGCDEHLRNSVSGATYSGYNIKNNIFYGSTTRAIQTDAGASLAMDYNLYYDDTAMGLSSGTNYTTFALWKAGTTYDDNSVNSEPLLDANYYLTISSPAIDAGVDVSLTRDFLNNPIVGDPDIGCFEYVAIGGNTYYVKTGGNDSYNGLSDVQAWAHHPWMSTWTGTVTLAAGDIVYMKKGDTWTSSASGHYMTVGQNGTAGNYITTSSYGSGNRPIIQRTGTSSAVIYAAGKSYLKFDGLNIDHESGTYSSNAGCGIYIDGSTTPCHDIIIINCEIANIPYIAVRSGRDAYNITIGDINATTTATTASYSNHIHHFGYAGILLTGCNPADDRSDFNVYYNYIHDAMSSTAGSNEYGISFTVNSSSHSNPKYAYARYNRVEYIKTWSAISNHGGSYIYYQDNYVRGFGRSGITFGSSSTTAIQDHLYADRNIVEQTAGSYVTGSENCFIGVSNEGVVNASFVYMRDNTVFWTARPTTSVFRGIKTNTSENVEISGNTIYNGGTSSSAPAIYIQGSHNDDITISGNFVKEWGPAITLDGNGIVGSAVITNNIVTKPGGNACLRIDVANLPSTADVTLYNNTFLQNNYAYGFYSAYGITAGGSLDAKNNIFGRSTSGDLTYWRWGGTISGTFTCDYNLYWNTSTASPFYVGGSARNWAAWEGLGYDTHSPNITATLDPVFANALYSDDTDFRIQSSSPAINKGVAVGLTTDYGGGAIVGLPDIGAWELETPVVNPVVVITTSVIAGVSNATAGGNVTYDGGGTVTARGVCWALTADPTTADSHTSDGSGSGTFTSFLTGLTPATVYHTRAYAVNQLGTGYGADVRFTTASNVNFEGDYIFFNGKPVFFENKIVVSGTGIVPPNLPPIITHYYVSNSGNDANNGVTSGTAWQTIAKVNASIFQPSDQILFKRGDTWNERLIIPSSGDSSAHIVFSSYGIGNKPIIDGSFVFSDYVTGSGGVSPEMVTNGDFSEDDHWTKGADVTISDGKAHSGGTINSFILAQYIDCELNHSYSITFTISNYVSGIVRAQPSGMAANNGTNRSADGTYTEIITVVSFQDGLIYFYPNDLFQGDIDDITIHEVTTIAGVYSKVTSTTEMSLVYEDGLLISAATSEICTDGNWYFASAIQTLFYKPTTGDAEDHVVTYIPYSFGVISVTNRTYITIENIEIDNFDNGVFGAQGLWPDVTAVMNHITVKNCDFNYGLTAIQFWLFTDVPSDGGVIDGNYIYRSEAGIELFVDDGILDYSYTGWVINNNEVDEGGTYDGINSRVAGDIDGIGAQNFQNGFVTDNYIHSGITRAIAFYGNGGGLISNNLITRNYVKDNNAPGFYITGDWQSGWGWENNIISYNIFDNCGSLVNGTFDSYAVRFGNDTRATITNLFVNNIIYGGARDLVYFEENRTPNFPQYITFKNNIIGDYSRSAYYLFDAKTNLIIDYNLYDVDGMFYDGTNWRTLVYIIANTTYGDNDIIGDPLFVSPTDFHLQIGSPCINKGIDVGLTEDYEGNSIVGLPDMGCYEKQ